MNSKANNMMSTRSINIMNIFLLSIHSCLLILFSVTGIWMMAGVNVVSVLWYAGSFLLIKKEWTTFYIFATFWEIMIHMFLAVISMGWNSGFELYFIACTVIVFYADYFSVRLGNHHIKGNEFSIISGLMYLASLLVTKFVGAVYVVDDRLLFAWMIVNSAVVFVFITMFLGMLTEIATFYEAELSKQATHDKLTGMVNRHYLVEQLEQIYASGNMSGYWLAILDIDNFKGINDKYGHLCGDFVLKTLSEMVKKICGDRIVCRWGGEEFVIVGSDHGKNDKGVDVESALLEDIRRNAAIKDFAYDQKTVVNLTVTIGMARHQDGQTVDEWVNLADRRLYYGKQTGKNRVIETGQETA